MLKKQNVQMHLNCEVSEDLAELESCDYIILATGAASPAKLHIPGVEHTVDVIDAHLHSEANDDTVICGGGLSGCDYALELAKDYHKKNITIIEMKEEIASDMFFINKVSLIKELLSYHVRIITSAKIIQFRENEITYLKDDTQQVIKAKRIFKAFWNEP